MTRSLPLSCRWCHGRWSTERLCVQHWFGCRAVGNAPRPERQSPARALIVEMVARGGVG
jgi:hypothetical protein